MVEGEEIDERRRRLAPYRAGEVSKGYALFAGGVARWMLMRPLLVCLTKRFSQVAEFVRKRRLLSEQQKNREQKLQQHSAHGIRSVRQDACGNTVQV